MSRKTDFAGFRQIRHGDGRQESLPLRRQPQLDGSAARALHQDGIHSVGTPVRALHELLIFDPLSQRLEPNDQASELDSIGIGGTTQLRALVGRFPPGHPHGRLIHRTR